MGNKEQIILQTAEKLFAAGRYHEVTLDSLCKEAGIGKGTVYRYFEDKEDLYYQVILHGQDELVASVRAVAADAPGPSEGLRHTAKCLAEFFHRRRPLFRLMRSEQMRGSGRKRQIWKQWRQKSEEIVEVVAGFLKAGAEDGSYELGPFAPEAAARLLMGMLRAGMRHSDEMPGGRDWPLRVVDFFESGMRAEG